MKTFTKQYDELMNDATQKIISIIETKGSESKFRQDKCVSLLNLTLHHTDFNEIINDYGILKLIDDHGLEYSITTFSHDVGDIFRLFDSIIKKYS